MDRRQTCELDGQTSINELLGEPVAQNVQGDRLYDVRDTGQLTATRVRGDLTRQELSWHTDYGFNFPPPYLGLLVLRTAEDKEVTIPVKDIAERGKSTKSLMPEGIADQLTKQIVLGTNPDDPTNGKGFLGVDGNGVARPCTDLETKTMDINIAGDSGFTFVGLTVSKTALGGEEVVTILRRAVK